MTAQHKIIVIDEHTLGCINPAQPNYAQILGASILRGALEIHGLLLIQFDGVQYKATRPATLADFETFRVHPDGFLNDLRYDFIREQQP